MDQLYHSMSLPLPATRKNKTASSLSHVRCGTSAKVTPTLLASSRPQTSNFQSCKQELLLIALKRKAIKLGADTASHPVWIGQRGVHNDLQIVILEKYKGCLKASRSLCESYATLLSHHRDKQRGVNPVILSFELKKCSKLFWTKAQIRTLHVFFSECYSFSRGKSRHLIMKKSIFFPCFGMCVLCVEERDIFHSVASYKCTTAGIQDVRDEASSGQQGLQGFNKISQVTYSKGRDWENSADIL